MVFEQRANALHLLLRTFGVEYFQQPGVNRLAGGGDTPTTRTVWLNQHHTNILAAQLRTSGLIGESGGAANTDNMGNPRIAGQLADVVGQLTQTDRRRGLIGRGSVVLQRRER